MQSGRVVEHRIINTDTGEVEHRKEMPFSLFREDQGYMLFVNKHNVRMFPDVPLPNELNKNDIANLYLLSRGIYGSTNMLAYRGSGNVIKPMAPKDMARTMDLSIDRANRFLRKMIKLGMIAKVDVEIEETVMTQYYMNPIHFFSSKYLPLNLYLLFKEQMDRYIPDWMRKKYQEMITK